MTRRTILMGSVGALWPRASARWIAADLSGRIRESNWPDSEQPVCFGSLLKPFLALAYLAAHSESPVIDCTGAGCWYRKGHGRQDMIAGLANSCNVYFLRLSETLNRAALDTTCLSYGLAPPSRLWPASRLIGLGPGWPQAPQAVIRAFSLLARNASEPHTRVVLAGMLRCCESGTAKGIGLRCYAKTGTAAPSERRYSGEGYVIAIYPVDTPRTILLFSRHNTTGAEAATHIRPLLAELGS